LKPSEVIAGIYDRIDAAPLAPVGISPVWISLVSRETALARAHALEADPQAAAKPLYGLPFAIKDNIDLAGLPTTAGCPAFAYSPSANATVVQRLLDAGAIAIGKTNLDQFATGLVGTRSPHGACSSVFDSRYISGGSSSGSAVAVASGLANFALGTDTAGSGRVPAAFNGLIGLKPTRGLLSTHGVVPACRTLDCVSILTKTCREAHAVLQAARGFDPLDSFSRTPTEGQDAAPWLGGPFRFGVPAENQLQFFGDEEAAALYRQAIADMESIGGEKVEIDFSIFRAAADLLYSGPWVAERLAAIQEFVEAHADQMNPVVREIISAAKRFTAVEAFAAEYKLRELRRASEAEWRRMDIMLLPTTGTIYTHEAVAADPIRLNTNLGYYTNFVNLLDLAAVAVPAGFRTNPIALANARDCRITPHPLANARGSDQSHDREGVVSLPFGISLIGPAFSDEALLLVADRFHRAPGPPLELQINPPGCIPVAVVGAHLTGQPLNWQLTERGARLMQTSRTAPGYRLYALPGSVPPKPGLVRDDAFQGPGIEVEVWAVPADRFGGYVAAVPVPLGIGNATLEDGRSVKCFICEPYAIAGATEITQFGGWRKYLSQAC
jgi:allophanate hydrolase